MTLSDADEILPLIDHSKGDQGESDFHYNSLFQFNKQRNSNFLNKKKDSICENSLLKDPGKCRNISGVCSTQTYAKTPRFGHSSGQKIIYSWKNLSVYNISRNAQGFSAWKRINFWKAKRDSSLGQPKQILKNVCGVAYPGEFLAIMGGSGAGKTTLLNALTFQTGYNSFCRGTRCLNGIPVADENIIARLSAYVEQENLFIGTLTVKEHLIFQSLIRIDSNIPYHQKLKRVEDVITELGLEKCQHTMIGYEGRTKGISGGEKKRLSFASEILTNPPIMFCDEPTSGLDSFMALNVINVLKSMAIKDKTVICTIHQPSSEIFALFDKILLIAEGRTAFLGKPDEAICFFTELGISPPANYNPADFLIQLLAIIPSQEKISKDNIELICDSFDQSLQGMGVADNIVHDAQNQARGAECTGLCGHDIKKNPAWLILRWGSATTLSSITNDTRENLSSWSRCNAILDKNLRQSEYVATWISQFRALFWRSWINILKEPLLVKVRLFQTVVLSLVVGLLYHGQKLNENGVMNINGVLFTFLTNMTFQNLFAVISVFCNELPVFMKEQSNKLYRVDTYFLSKIFAEIPMFFAIPIIFTSITYYWIGLNPGLWHFAFTILILILVTNVATSFGYFISCISVNVMMALSIGPPVIIPFLLFGGFLLHTGKIPLYFKWLSYLSWFKYGNEALLINQWSDIKSIECNISVVTCSRTGEIVLEIYDFEKQNFWWDLGLLLILIFLFRFLAFLALFLKTKRYQRCS